MAESDESEMMEELRRALAMDRPPDALVQSARDSFIWRTVDAELAELLSDSAVEELSGVRSTDIPRTLEFATGESSIAVEVVDSGATLEIRGQLSPSGETELVVESTTESITLAVDEEGWFSGSIRPIGTVRLRAANIVTDWFAL